MFSRCILVWLLLPSIALVATAEQPPNPARGLDLLLNKAYLPPAFDQQTFDEVWQTWEEPLRSQAEAATPDQRRTMAFKRYGLVERENDPQHRPLQHVVDAQGNWTMNCLACHQGTVAGRVVPGVPNTQFALATLTHEIRTTKLRLGKKLTDLDIGAAFMPLGTTVGTTNAVMFGVVLMYNRDDDMNLVRRGWPPMSHHDHDAPAWWNTSLKTRLYADNFAPKGHRALMQFLASVANSAEQFYEWEDDYRHIEAYIDSLEPPKYPFAIDRQLAEQGRVAFERTCADCHGTYGQQASYPERVVPIDEVGTDAVRLEALSPLHRETYGRNWINQYGAAGEVIADPGGYLAPPLHGVWASAPYLHNGSVPTLWHLLHPGQRPIVWLRTDDNGYDIERCGLVVDELESLPDNVPIAAVRRRYFDTSVRGKSAAGHKFPRVLSHSERQAVLEYLKTL